MYILAIVGSQRKRGNTARLVQMIGAELGALAGRAGQPLTFETLYLGDLDIHPCRGCRSCFDRGEAKCPERDDLPAIKAKMDAADGLLLASPVYVDDVSGLVKTWMDRLAGWPLSSARLRRQMRLCAGHGGRQPDPARPAHDERRAAHLGLPPGRADRPQDGRADTDR